MLPLKPPSSQPSEVHHAPPTPPTDLSERRPRLSLAKETLVDVRATVGLDGFVDEIIAVVDKRHDCERFDAVRTIAAIGEKIRTAAGKSSNYELVVKQMKLGGNGPIMANALAALGLGVTYIGSVGYPDVHPVFRDFATRAASSSIGEPGHTDALEFDDGKLMLGKYTARWTRQLGQPDRPASAASGSGADGRLDADRDGQLDDAPPHERDLARR